MKALKQVEISQEIVEELIGCEKLVCKAPPSHLTLDKGNLKLSFTLQDSENPQHLFECFVRVSKFFPENFSVGMQFNPKHDPYRLLLIRMNGAHGQHLVFDHHDRPHIHIMDATELHKNPDMPKIIQYTTEYTHRYKDALAYFIKRVNLQDSRHTDVFSELCKPDLFDKP